jgi:hypothetical protein
MVVISLVLVCACVSVYGVRSLEVGDLDGLVWFVLLVSVAEKEITVVLGDVD